MRILSRTYLTIFVSCLVLILATMFQPSQAESVNESGALDGKVFIGKIGQNPKERFDDRLFFENGKMWSEICIRCGFQPGNYWTRNVGGNIHFRGEIIGDYGTFNYEGQIVDGTAKSSVFWSKERWYWTSSRKLSFEGSTKPGMEPFSAREASTIATEAMQSKLPGFCW